MHIGLDYDKTFTRDPELWLMFVKLAQTRGHIVHVVTMRYAGHEGIPVVKELMPVVNGGIHFTGRKAKRKFMSDLGIWIDIWIDDEPSFILMDAKG